LLVTLYASLCFYSFLLSTEYVLKLQFKLSIPKTALFTLKNSKNCPELGYPPTAPYRSGGLVL